MWIVWIVLLVIIVYVVRALAGEGKVPGNGKLKNQQNEMPLDILKKRLASGEINEDEYNRLRLKLEA